MSHFEDHICTTDALSLYETLCHELHIPEPRNADDCPHYAALRSELQAIADYETEVQNRAREEGSCPSYRRHPARHNRRGRPTRHSIDTLQKNS